MISKFIKIKNVGRWKNFSASGDITLGKVNIIYGENSQGKTTLVSIIRSLVLNKPELIKERRTFGINEEQYVELLHQGNKTLKFQNGNWNNCVDNLKDIEIFDEFFINENIYTGLEIQSEHQKCLYQFAIGEEGTRLAKEIEEKKLALQTKNDELNSLKKQINIITKNYFDVDGYIDLTKDEEINSKIEDKKQQLRIAEAAVEIKRKDFLEEIQPFSLPFDLNNLKSLLSKSLTTILEDALKRTKQHINKLDAVLQSDAESWIHQGLLVVENIKDNKCPFCQQDLEKAEATIKLYQQYFNQEYRELKENIEEYLRQIERINIEQLVNNVNSAVLNNNTLFEFWVRFLKDIEVPEIKDSEKYYSQISEDFGEVKSAIRSKSQRILASFEAVGVDKLSNSISEFNKIIENYNSSIRSLNKQINEIKNKQPDIDELRRAIEKLEIEKQRYSTEINELCEKYKSVEKEIDEARKLIDGKKEELKLAISQKVEKYGEETNKILEKFSVPFKIVKPKPTYRGRGEEPYFEYLLEVEGCEINPLEKAKFTLSGGDRNAFALAFFLAKIYIDGSIENKTIIFDDPISSFDTNRKRRTIEFIRDLSQKAKQTIVLTHLNTFAFELYDSIRDIGISPKCLQVINGNIKEWDINEDKKHPFSKNLSKLESFVNGQEEINLDEVRKLIRICLEDKLKFNYFKFFEDLGEECWLGPMVKKLREVNDDSRLKFKYSNKEQVISELGNLCEFSSPSHHSNITTQYKTDYTHDEIANYVQSTLKMIYEWL